VHTITLRGKKGGLLKEVEKLKEKRRKGRQERMEKIRTTEAS